MPYRVRDDFRDVLLAKAESGMGYQRVRGRAGAHFLVLNAEVALEASHTGTNPAPAVHAFLLVPPAPTPIHCGTVAPSYGQAGGGVEVRFDQPTQPGTAIQSYVIPDR